MKIFDEASRNRNEDLRRVARRFFEDLEVSVNRVEDLIYYHPIDLSQEDIVVALGVKYDEEAERWPVGARDYACDLAKELPGWLRDNVILGTRPKKDPP